MSKLKCPEFINLIRNYDIIGIQESKTDDTDVIEIPGYSIFFHTTEHAFQGLNRVALP